MSKRTTVFDAIDLGTQVTTATMDEFHVTVDPTIMMYDYGMALLGELERRNPLKYQAAVTQLLQLSQYSNIQQCVENYMNGLMIMRIQSIHGNCPFWRQAKEIRMTAVIQDALSCLGIITNRAEGYRIIPELKNQDVTFDMGEVLSFSDFLDGFSAEGLKVFRDAMPRGSEGDVDTMSCIIINQEVRSLKVDAHPTFSYIAGFLGLEPSVAQPMLRYGVRYDIMAYIKPMLLREVRNCCF